MLMLCYRNLIIVGSFHEYVKIYEELFCIAKMQNLIIVIFLAANITFKMGDS